MNVRGWSRCVLPPLLSLVAAGAAGCHSTSVTSGPTTAKCQLTVVPPPAIVAEGGTATISVTAPQECGWDVSTQSPWITDVTPVAGQGSGTVEFRAAPNSTPIARETDIVINQEKIRISQGAVSCAYTVVPATLTMTTAGGPGTINVSTIAGCAWTAASDVPWITITSAATGNGNGSVRFSVASNGGTVRTGNVTIADQSTAITQSSSTTPAPGPGGPSPTPSSGCTYSITPATYSVGAAGGIGPTVAVSTASGCTWTSVSNDSWITVTSGSSGNGNGSVSFTVASNPSNARNGSLTIAGQAFTVQQGTNCTFQVNHLTVKVPLSGDNKSVDVKASPKQCSWTASTSAAWITITSGASDTGDGKVQFTVAASTTPRSATLLVAGQTVTVTQQ
jgi:hypothetical protein